jgi:hypothetical protein
MKSIFHAINTLKELTFVEKKNKIEDSIIHIRTIIKGLFEKIKAIAIENRETEIQVKL